MSDTLIKFNWNVMVKYYSGDCVKALKLLNGCIARSLGLEKLRIYRNLQHNKPVDCWLRSPLDFVVNGATYNQKCVFLHLATKRNWLDFEEYGTTSLPIHVVEDLYSIDSLSSNPLLTINNDNVDLKY